MKKVMIGMITVLLSVGVIFVSASASDMFSSGISSEIENAIEQSPEISSILDGAANGEINADALKDALGKIEGLDMDQLLQGLDGLTEDDGLLGKISSILGPESDGLAGILSGIGGNLGGSGAANSAGGILSGILDRFNSSQTTQAPTVHTTSASYNESVQTPSVYTPNYNISGSGSSTINYNQYTGTYTLPAQVTVGEVTTQAYIPAETTVPTNNVSVAIPANSAQTQAAKSTSWKKIVGALLVLGSFAAIAAVVIKKSM